MKLVYLSLMGGLLHLVQRGGDWAGSQPTQVHSTIMGWSVKLGTARRGLGRVAACPGPLYHHETFRIGK